jgi:hypothetical protein
MHASRYCLYRLQDQVCYGMYNQATVHQYRGEFLLFQAAREDKPGAEVAAEAEAHFKVGGRAGGWVVGSVCLLFLRAVLCRRSAHPPCFSRACIGNNPLQKAEAQLDAAVAYKAAFLDGYLGKSALAQLRAKLAADYLITPVK